MAGRGSDAYGWKYVHSFPSPRLGPFLGYFFFPSSFCGSTNSILNNALFSFFFPTHFYPVVQCFPMLVPSTVISPHGRSGKWLTCHGVRTLFLPLSKIGSFFLAISFFLLLCRTDIALIHVYFWKCSLLFFFPTHFYPWTFLCCYVWCSVSYC